MTSFTISRWRPRRLHTGSGFVLVDVTVFRRSNSTWIPNFIQIGPPVTTIRPLIDFQDGSCGGAILLPVSYLMMSLSSEGQHLSTNLISLTRLNPRLRYNYFRFGKTTVRHIGILLPVSILTTSPYVLGMSKTRVRGLLVGENLMILRSLVLTHYQRVTDRQTDTPPVAKSRSRIAERDNKSSCFIT